jgi:hypothetical protein
VAFFAFKQYEIVVYIATPFLKHFFLISGEYIPGLRL